MTVSEADIADYIKILACCKLMGDLQLHLRNTGVPPPVVDGVPTGSVQYANSNPSFDWLASYHSTIKAYTSAYPASGKQGGILLLLLVIFATDEYIKGKGGRAATGTIACILQPLKSTADPDSELKTIVRGAGDGQAGRLALVALIEKMFDKISSPQTNPLMQQRWSRHRPQTDNWFFTKLKAIAISDLDSALPRITTYGAMQQYLTKLLSPFLAHLVNRELPFFLPQLVKAGNLENCLISMPAWLAFRGAAGDAAVDTFYDEFSAAYTELRAGLAVGAKLDANLQSMGHKLRSPFDQEGGTCETKRQARHYDAIMAKLLVGSESIPAGPKGSWPNELGIEWWDYNAQGNHIAPFLKHIVGDTYSPTTMTFNKGLGREAAEAMVKLARILPLLRKKTPGCSHLLYAKPAGSSGKKHPSDDE